MRETLPHMVLLTSSDHHIGRQSVEQINKEYYGEEGYLEHVRSYAKLCIEENMVFGGVAITGDLYDHQLSLNSVHARWTINFIHELAKLVITEYGGKLILIRGTRSHDLDQLNVFEPLLELYPEKFHLVNKVSTIDISGYSVLCIPEEYMQNQEEYYKEYFSKTYDIILGHGFFKFNCFDKNEVERSMPDMPIFDQEEFCKMAKVTVFGHDHNYKCYRNQIYYNGSYSRLQHGEESDKGGLVIQMCNDDYSVERFINSLAPTYLSIVLDTLFDKVEDITFEESVKRIKKIKTKVQFLKVKITKDVVNYNPTLVTLLQNIFSTQYKRLGIVIDAPIFSLKDGESVLLLNNESNVNENESSNINLKYDFLFNANLSLEEKISKFVETKHQHSKDIYLSIDDIRDALSE